METIKTVVKMGGEKSGMSLLRCLQRKPAHLHGISSRITMVLATPGVTHMKGVNTTLPNLHSVIFGLLQAQPPQTLADYNTK